MQVNTLMSCIPEKDWRIDVIAALNENTLSIQKQFPPPDPNNESAWRAYQMIVTKMMKQQFKIATPNGSFSVVISDHHLHDFRSLWKVLTLGRQLDQPDLQPREERKKRSKVTKQF